PLHVGLNPSGCGGCRPAPAAGEEFPIRRARSTDVGRHGNHWNPTTLERCAARTMPGHGERPGTLASVERGAMSDVVVKPPMQYLDQATQALRELGIVPPPAMEAPIVGLLEKISDLDPDRIVIIARTLGQTSVFNEIVR